MKTLSYNTEKEIRVGIMIIVIITALLTTFKIRELQVNNANSFESVRPGSIEMTNTLPMMPLADAKLIEEPAPVSNTSAIKDLATKNELAVQMKNWINNQTYWNEDVVENEKTLTLQMTGWLKNGTFYSDETFDNPSAGKVKDQLSNTEIASQMKTWIACGNYWNETSN